MQQNGFILRQLSVLSQPPMQNWFNRLGRTALTAFCLLGLTGASNSPGKIVEQLELKVGILQKFGEEPTDRITLQATEGDRLTLRFLAGNMQPQTLPVKSVTVEVLSLPLSTPVLDERVVLGNYRSFETAEDSAKQLQKQGIPTEIAQPDRWQVWAKRDVYRTPLLRRLLVHSLQASGDRRAYVESEIYKQQQRISWVVNGLRYNRQLLDITTTKNLLKVSRGKKDNSPRLYSGQFRIQPNAYGTYTLVNQVPLETYLRGVVPHEIAGGAPYGAQEAQAIIARTYALRNLRRFAVDNYELCADVQCQVYRGLTGTEPISDRAIAATKSKVLTYNNQLVDALYSSTTGGITAPFNDVWNGADRPYLQALVDSTGKVWDLSRNNLADEQNLRKFISLKDGFNETGWQPFRWRKESSLVDIAKNLQRYLKRTKAPFTQFQSIKQIRVVQRSRFGRILKLEVQTDKGIVEIFKDDVRSAFIPPLSTLFYLDPIYAEDKKTLKGYAFVGGGFGHGVGMSQSGAYNLAKRDWSSTQILNFYYPSAQLQSLNESIVFWQDSPTPANADR